MRSLMFLASALTLIPDAVGGTTGTAPPAPASLETLLRPDNLAPMIQEPTFQANLEFHRKDPHNETVLRKLAASALKVANGQTTDPNEILESQFYNLVVTMGPVMAQNLVPYQKAKVASTKAAPEEKIPTWVDAVRHRFARVARDAIYASQKEVHAELLSGKIKTTGVPDYLKDPSFSPTGDNGLFFEVVKLHGSPQTELKVDELEFEGLSEDMKGSKVGIRFGWYADVWRSKGKKGKKAKADADAAKAEAEKKETPPAQTDAPPAEPEDDDESEEIEGSEGGAEGSTATE